MTPPLFDSIAVVPPSSIILHDTLRKRSFTGTYEINNQILRWTFQPKVSHKPIEHAVHYSFAQDGALVLRGAAAKDSNEQQVEWLFLRPDRFLPNTTVSGDWIMPTEKGEPEAHNMLLPDGTLGKQATKPGEEFWGFYRVWRNPQNELILTTVMWIQGEGEFAMFQHIEQQDGELRVTSRVPPGFTPKPPETWKRAPLSAKAH